MNKEQIYRLKFAICFRKSESEYGGIFDSQS